MIDVFPYQWMDEFADDDPQAPNLALAGTFKRGGATWLAATTRHRMVALRPTGDVLHGPHRAGVGHVLAELDKADVRGEVSTKALQSWAVADVQAGDVEPCVRCLGAGKNTVEVINGDGVLVDDIDCLACFGTGRRGGGRWARPGPMKLVWSRYFSVGLDPLHVRTVLAFFGRFGVKRIAVRGQGSETAVGLYPVGRDDLAAVIMPCRTEGLEANEIERLRATALRLEAP